MRGQIAATRFGIELPLSIQRYRGSETTFHSFLPRDCHTAVRGLVLDKLHGFEVRLVTFSLWCRSNTRFPSPLVGDCFLFSNGSTAAPRRIADRDWTFLDAIHLVICRSCVSHHRDSSKVVIRIFLKIRENWKLLRISRRYSTSLRGGRLASDPMVFRKR